MILFLFQNLKTNLSACREKVYVSKSLGETRKLSSAMIRSWLTILIILKPGIVKAICLIRLESTMKQ